MKRSLLVIDIQSNVVAVNRSGSLIESANAVISKYDPGDVIYIYNCSKFKNESHEAKFVDGLDVVSDNVLIKRKMDAFSNPDLLSKLCSMGVEAVDLIGADGNWCVKYTALSARANGFDVNILTCAVASQWERLFRMLTRKKLIRSQIILIDSPIQRQAH